MRNWLKYLTFWSIIRKNSGEGLFMVVVISYIIAVILTVILAIFLYPISMIFFLVGYFGKMTYKLGDFIFNHTNKGIKKLWSDIKHTKIVHDDVSDEVGISEALGEVEQVINKELEK